jgi:hypothetical protein
MIKYEKIHHSVTENGKLQVRLVTEYQDDTGNILDKKYGDPMTPADTKDMTGWDDRSKDVVTAITDPDTLLAFEAECTHTTHVGLEECVSYDRVIEEDGKIAVRQITRIFDDGVEVSKKYHRSWIMPGDDPESNDVISKAVAKKLHTKKVKDAYKAKQATLTLEPKQLRNKGA